MRAEMKMPEYKIILTIILVCCQMAVYAQEKINLAPMPSELIMREGVFRIDSSSSIHTPPESRREAELFASYVQQYYGITISVMTVVPGTRNNPLTDKSILLAWQKSDSNPSAYTLSINETGCSITGDNAGIFYGLQTLQQLLPAGKKTGHSLNIPAMDIRDQPRFAYRGMHLDVGRHMFSVDYIKKYIDYLAWHKFNYFHWHLTEDQGWRLEIKQFPELTKTGSCRKQTLLGRYGSDKYDGKAYCGFYTQEEVKDIIRYASDRHINIIPEIDMPGHSKAALASYPFLGCSKGPYQVMETWGVAEEVLCAGNDSTYAFMEAVLDEVIDLFPSKYIHIGGDECPKQQWKKCPVCQDRIRQLKLKDEHELQSYFIQRIEKKVNARGRTIIGWDEILEGGLAPNAVVMSWRGEAGGIAAAKLGHYVIMTPENPLYINHAQSKMEDSITQGGYNPLEAVYAYDPVPAILDEKQASFILGAQGNLWSEYINNEKKLEYMLFPRISALSEVLWSPKINRNWNSFEKRLPGLMERYALWGVQYSTAFYDLQPTVTRGKNGFPSWKLDSKLPDAKIIYVKDSSNPEMQNYSGPVEIRRSGTYGASITDKHKRMGNRWIWQTFNINKATGKKISLLEEPNKSYSLGGAFSLVDGIQNETGMIRSAQFLGFNGRDMVATIDMGKPTRINSVTLHAFEQTGSWIYRPAEVSFQYSSDGKTYRSFQNPISVSGTKNLEYRLQEQKKARWIRIKATNPGMIKDGLPGAGHRAWIFFDEIEIN